MLKRNNIIVFIQAFVISVILFSLINVNGNIYLRFVAAIWLLILFAYGSWKNYRFLLDSLCFTVGNFIAYSWIYYMSYGFPKYLDFEEMFLLICCIIEVSLALCMAAFGYVRAEKTDKKSRENLEQAELFSAREYDCKRLKDYLEATSIVGLNGPWGSGKSFLVDHLCRDEEICRQYEFIRIDLLSFRLDKLEQVLLSELERVLEKNRIFSKHVGKWKKLMGTHEGLSRIQGVFLSDDGSVATMFRDVSLDVQKLKKKILIIYEDIDRIADRDVIRKLFDISEKLAGDRIRILYQFDEEELREKDFDRRYLEKYIPHIVNMTDISFEKCTKQLLKELKIEEKELKYEELRFLSGPIIGDYSIKKALQMDGEFRIDLHIPIRKVKIMLQEFQILIKENPIFGKEKNKKVVLVFLLMKHVLDECYDMLNLTERPVNSLVFQYQGNTYTMAQLIYQRKRNIEEEENGFSIEVLKDIFKEKQNRNVYAVLAFLGYHFEIFDEKGMERKSFEQGDDLGNKRRKIGLEKAADIKKQDENEKIDRLLWNLLANGKSEFTNIEHMVEKLDNDVLLKSINEQDKAWQQFANDYFHEENLWKDNHTVFRFGVDSFLKIFQAFRVSGASTEQWIRLLEFYFRKSSDSFGKIKNEYLMIENLNYCDLTKNAVYLWVIRKLPTMFVEGNMNHEECYHKFLKEYLKAAEYWQYTEEYESWKLDFSAKIADYKDLVVDVLRDMIEKMENSNEKCLIDKIKQERSDVITFLKWNLELIEKEHSLRYPEGGFRTSTSTKVVHKDADCYEMLRKKKESINLENSEEWEKFVTEIDEAYGDSKLYVREAEELSERMLK